MDGRLNVGRRSRLYLSVCCLSKTRTISKNTTTAEAKKIICGCAKRN